MLETTKKLHVTKQILRIGLTTFAFLAIWSAAAAASDPPAGTPAESSRESTVWGPAVNLTDIAGGELLARRGDAYHVLPQVETDVRVRVTGIMSHGRVRQRFVNPSHETIEAMYVFPLPERAAVQHMEIRIGDRRIVSRVEERAQAKQTYETAKSQGKKAALVEQERPNLFTLSVANINPNESIEVHLEYVEEVGFADGEFGVTYPLTLTPRFIPRGALAIEEGTAATIVASAGSSTIVADADRVTPRFVAASDSRAPRASFEVVIDAGIPLRQVQCGSHETSIVQDGDTWTVRPVQERVAADRDIQVRWSPQVGSTPEVTFLTETHDNQKYGLLMIVPPQVEQTNDESSFATQTIFVIDISSSMAGPSMDQAKVALAEALQHVRPGDRFNIVAFNDSLHPMTSVWQDATPEALERARKWTLDLEANGGTMIHPALRWGVDQFGPVPDGINQRIMFLTDGAVGNEAQMLATIVNELDDVRLHTVGIGAAPNRYLMREMASRGGGASTFVYELNTAREQISGFFQKLQRPVLTDLELQWKGVNTVETYPARLGDVHAGDPLFVSFRFVEDPGSEVLLTGRTRTGLVSTVISLRDGQGQSGVATRWARAKVQHWMDALHADVRPERVRQEVVAVGLEHHLVTQYTSLVAVEERITAQGVAVPASVANALPIGSQLLTVLPKGGTDDRRKLLTGLVLTLCALLVAAVTRNTGYGNVNGGHGHVG